MGSYISNRRIPFPGQKQIQTEKVKKKTVEEIFGDKKSLTLDEVKELMKAYFDPDKVKAENIHIYNNFTWGDFLKIMEEKKSMTKEEFAQLLNEK